MEELFRKHEFTGPLRGARTDDTALESIFGQHRQPAGMIDMRMGENDVGDNAGVKWEDAVLGRGFSASALKHAAVQQNSICFRGEHVHGPGNLPGRSDESNVHVGLLEIEAFIAVTDTLKCHLMQLNAKLARAAFLRNRSR